jgi:hypothetical protein
MFRATSLRLGRDRFEMVDGDPFYVRQELADREGNRKGDGDPCAQSNRESFEPRHATQGRCARW